MFANVGRHSNQHKMKDMLAYHLLLLIERSILVDVLPSIVFYSHRQPIIRIIL